MYSMISSTRPTEDRLTNRNWVPTNQTHSLSHKYVLLHCYILYTCNLFSIAILTIAIIYLLYIILPLMSTLKHHKTITFIPFCLFETIAHIFVQNISLFCILCLCCVLKNFIFHEEKNYHSKFKIIFNFYLMPLLCFCRISREEHFVPSIVQNRYKILVYISHYYQHVNVQVFWVSS